jgi:hypothetical protein
MSQQVHIFRVGNRQVIGGLEWRALIGDDGRRKQEMKSASAVLGSKHGTAYESPTGAQYVGFIPQGASRQAYSALSGAAWLCDAYPENSVLYIQRLQSGQFWLVAVGGGEIDTRFDKVFEEQEAIAMIDAILTESMQEAAKLQVVYSGGPYPVAQLIARFSPREGDFAALIGHKSADTSYRVKQLHGITPMQMVVAVSAIVVAGAGYVGLQFWNKYQEQQEFERMQAYALEQQQITERMATMTDLRIAQAVTAAAADETATAAVGAVVDACLDRVKPLGRGVAGWQVGIIECSPVNGEVVAQMQRVMPQAGGVGTTADLVKQTEARRWKASPDFEGTRAKLLIPSNGPLPVRIAMTPDQMPAQSDIAVNLTSAFQLMMVASREIQINARPLEPREITYNDLGNPARIKQAPPEKGFMVGTAAMQGRGLWALRSVSRVDWPFARVTKLELRPEGDGFAWILEIVYVASNS